MMQTFNLLFFEKHCKFRFKKHKQNTLDLTTLIFCIQAEINLEFRLWFLSKMIMHHSFQFNVNNPQSSILRPEGINGHVY